MSLLTLVSDVIRRSGASIPSWMQHKTSIRVTERKMLLHSPPPRETISSDPSKIKNKNTKYRRLRKARNKLVEKGNRRIHGYMLKTQELKKGNNKRIRKDNTSINITADDTSKKRKTPAQFKPYDHNKSL